MILASLQGFATLSILPNSLLRTEREPCFLKKQTVGKGVGQTVLKIGAFVRFPLP